MNDRQYLLLAIGGNDAARTVGTVRTGCNQREARKKQTSRQQKNREKAKQRRRQAR